MPSIPLVRMEGKIFTDGAPSLVPERFVEEQRLLIASRSPETKAAETAFGMRPSLYFYAGHTQPEFGDAVLVYGAEVSDAHAGDATPFDSGGLYNGKVHVDGLDDTTARCAYFKEHLVPLDQWRADLIDYVGEHFSSPTDYVLGKAPIKPERTGRILHPQNSERAWKWEVRFHEDHALLDGLLVAFLSDDYDRAVRDLVETADPAVNRLWMDRFHRKQVRAAPPGDSVHAHAKERIAEWLAGSTL